MTPDQANEIQRSLGRIEGKLEAHDDRFDGLEMLYSRVGALEGWRNWLVGAGAVFAAAFAFFLKVMGK